jgi:DNA invertase Pin-like site-specific DNA recombinase
MQTQSNPVPLRLVGYARVSTAAQALQAVSIPEQERDMRSWCEANGHTLVAVRGEDGGVSGTEGLEGRFAFVEALEMIKTGAVDGVLVRELDRLARDVLIQEQFMREVWDLGGEVLSTHPSEANLRDDPEDPTRKLIRRLIGCVHEWEREMIRLRLRRGRAHMASKGQYVGGKPLHPRYGYQLVRGEDGTHAWDPIPNEQEVIRRIVEGRTAGLSSRAIAAELNAAGITPPAGLQWWHSAVQRVTRTADRMAA